MTSDAAHPNPLIARKLERIYGLHRKQIDLRLARSPYAQLLEALGNPQQNLPPVIHLAGTNGKGSTLAFLRAIYEAAGYKVHAYTSPHLFAFNERIRLAGTLISDDALLAAMERIDAVQLDDTLTFFEYTTALAFMVMAENPADICLLETGMGGRLDCTNVVPDKLLTILTKISFDHMEFLGSSLPEIAAEKAGIMQQRVPCLVAPQFRAEEVMPVIQRIAHEKDVPLLCAGTHWAYSTTDKGWDFVQEGNNALHLPAPGLYGAHQFENAATAVMAVELLHKRLPVNPAHIGLGVSRAHWPGRLDRVRKGVLAAMLPGKEWQLWYDGGHNDSGAAALVQVVTQWRQQGAHVHLVVSLGADKDVGGFLAGFIPHITSLTFLDLPDGRNPQSAADMQRKYGSQSVSMAAHTPEEALRQLLKAESPDAQEPQIVLFCGSLYRAASILPLP